MPNEISRLQIAVDSKGVKDAGKNLDNFTRSGALAETRTKQLRSSALQMGDGFKRAGAIGNTALASLGVSALTLTGTIVGATRAWLEFDKAMRQVNSIAGFTAAQFKTVRGQVLEMSTALGIDATDAAKGLYEVIQADIPKENAIEFLTVAAKAAEANATSTSTAVTALKNVINAYGIDASKASEISDKLFATVLYGGATFDELAASLSGATVVGSAVGIKFEEILGIITTLTAQGTKTAEAVTQVERSMTAFLNPSEEMRKAFQLLHVENGQQLLDQYGLVGSLQKLTAAYAGNQDGLIKALSSIPAYQAALGLTGEKAADAAKGLRNVEGAIGSTDKAFAAGTGSVQRSINMVGGAVTQLVETMENSLGAISKFAEALQGISLMIKEISGTGFFGSGADVTNAMNQGGSFGASLKIEQIKELERAQASLIKSGADASKAGNFLDYVTAGGANNARLAAINGEIKALQGSLGALSESDKNLGFLQYEINDVSKALKETTDPKDVEEYNMRLNGLRADYSAYTGEVERLKKVKDDAAEADKKAAAEAVKKAEADAKHAKEVLALEEERKKVLKSTNADAVRLSTSEIDKMREKQDAIRESIRLGVENGGVDAKVGEAAIANLEKQIGLMGEKNAKAGKGGGAGGNDMRDVFTKFEDSLPELSNNYETDYERFAREEKELQDSYDKRREIILASTKLTEDQKAKLLNDTETQYTERQRRMELERHKIMVQGVADLFGNLAQIASVFGKKGAKAAKALAIVQATVKMYESATSAYASAASIPVYGWIAAPIAAGAALAAGAANISAIKSQDEYAGAFAIGGAIGAGQVGLVGEAGPELVRGPAMVTSAQSTRDRGFASGGDGGAQVFVSITNNTGAPVTEKRTKEGDKTMVEFIIGQAKDAIAGDIRKGGTPVAKAMQDTYNLRRGN